MLLSAGSAAPVRPVLYSLLLQPHKKSASTSESTHLNDIGRSCPRRRGGCCKAFEERLSFDGNNFLVSSNNWHCAENEGQNVESRILAYRKKCNEEDGGEHFYKEFAGCLRRVWGQRYLAHKYYEKAMEVEPRNGLLVREYAEFVWDEVGNAVKAEEIYERGVREHPQDVELVGGYAWFLWNSTDS